MKCPNCGYEYEDEFREEIEAQNKRLREWAKKVAERSRKWY